MAEITELLQAWNNGDKDAMNKLMPLVDEELKKIAHNYMRNERAGHILQTTALVNEALIKLIRENISWENRKQFYGFTARRMRQVLFDYARKQQTEKRGNRANQVDMAEAEAELSQKSKELELLEEALMDLAKVDKRKVTIIESRFFIGLNNEEIAQLLGISPATVAREWSFARSWLAERMKVQE
jgi:RNA polymerase sigma factor (TIGR02999 family)